MTGIDKKRLIHDRRIFKQKTTLGILNESDNGIIDVPVLPKIEEYW
jgi:hypothetical protein